MPVLVAKMTIIGVSSFATNTGRKMPVLAEKKHQYWQKMPEMCSCDSGFNLDLVLMTFVMSCGAERVHGITQAEYLVGKPDVCYKIISCDRIETTEILCC